MLGKGCLSTRWFVSLETGFQILLAVCNAEHIVRLVIMYDTAFIF